MTIAGVRASELHAADSVQTVRTFFACPAPPTLVQTATELQRRLAMSALPLRMTPLSGLHVTTLFLGNLALDAAMHLWGVAENELRQIPPAKASAQDMLTLPEGRAPTVVVLRLVDDPHLRQIHMVLRELAASQGLRVERRPFLAHLTVARVQGVPSPDLGARIRTAIPSQVFDWANRELFDRVCMYRSDAPPSGQCYRVLGSVHLRDGAA